jgi:hypothetical protein
MGEKPAMVAPLRARARGLAAPCKIAGNDRNGTPRAESASLHLLALGEGRARLISIRRAAGKRAALKKREKEKERTSCSAWMRHRR